MIREKNVIKFSVWLSMLLVVSCTNFSKLCYHSNYKRVNKNQQNIKMEELDTAYSQVNYIETTQNSDALKLTWEILKDVSFKKKWNKEYGIEFMYPNFGKKLKELEGKEFYISGYMIPLDINAGLYAISKFNFASCFFCGGAGPESIISLRFKTKPKRYKTDAFLTMKGFLELNDSNVDDYFYIFHHTEEFKLP